jgi:multidrug efflux pump subunit AcrA (membrane-fusion protein)
MNKWLVLLLVGILLFTNGNKVKRKIEPAIRSFRTGSANASNEVKSLEKNDQAIADDTKSLEKSVPARTRTRHTVSATVAKLENIQVEEGDRVEIGQTLVDNPEERKFLETKRRELELAIATNQPVPIPPSPPIPNYSAEVAAVESARAMLAAVSQTPLPEYRFTTTELIQVMDKAVIEKRQALVLERVKAEQTLNQAIANLQTAKSDYQQRLSDYQSKVMEVERENAERELLQAKFRRDLAELQLNFSNTGATLSPYSGRVRQVKVLGQSESGLKVEITLLVSER